MKKVEETIKLREMERKLEKISNLIDSLREDFVDIGRYRDFREDINEADFRLEDLKEAIFNRRLDLEYDWEE